MIRILLLIAIISYNSLSIEFDEHLRNDFQDFLDNFREVHNIKGVSVCVKSKDDLWLGTSGISNEEQPVLSEMLFGIGSITKTMTATVILKLCEEGVINLDEKIGKWFDGHEFIDSDITIRQLLNHTSGLYDYSANPDYHNAIYQNAMRIFSPRELLQFIHKPLFPKGTDWQYCNTNYMLAGIIISESTGKKVSELYREYIWDNIGLSNTYLAVEEEMTGIIANRWVNENNLSNIPINAAFSGAWTSGSVFSTAYETALFVEALNSAGIINKESLNEMFDFVAASDYGLGISKKIIDGSEVRGHTGSIRGYNSIALYIPKYEITIVILVNSSPASPVFLAERIIRHLNQNYPSSYFKKNVKSILSIFPNPATDFITIQLSNKGLQPFAAGDKVQIFDMLGLEVISTQSASQPPTGEGNLRIDVSHLPAGVYFIKINCSNGACSIVEKFVKQL
ncbi:MAG: serine hydrolase [Candidatus Kapabacteria bacterium]|nr:serine hydrolase [Ignavibacteriota bacterium]MCW5884809.1 serine hydrolase [Candidatus Kapabacteria bacterium]